ncbi:hypothetical protein MKX03_026977 [Papaver bracteatum]|nr:hypothetical protein MKX03_026977 [Papaver bracteatum]
MPNTAPEIKWRSVEKSGGKAVLFGASLHEAQLYAKDRAEVEGRTFVPFFDHSHIIMGQGTAGMEILRQAKEPLHAIFAPIGVGLIAGVAAYVKMVCPQDGYEIFNSNALVQDMIEEKNSILEPTGALALACAEAYCEYYGLKD